MIFRLCTNKNFTVGDGLKSRSGIGPKNIPVALGSPDGNPVWLRLAYAGETKVRRHVKIRREANLFDPQWQDYFAERAFHKKFGVTRQQAGMKPS